jgi:hypothetical protein
MNYVTQLDEVHIPESTKVMTSLNARWSFTGLRCSCMVMGEWGRPTHQPCVSCFTGTGHQGLKQWIKVGNPGRSKPVLQTLVYNFSYLVG